MTTVQVNTSIEEEDVIKLDQLAKKIGIDRRSPYVRFLIRKEWDRVFGEVDSTTDSIHQSDTQDS